MRIVLPGTCQARGLGLALSAMRPDIEVLAFHVDAPPRMTREELFDLIRPDDVVISQIVAKADDPLFYDRLKDRAARTTFLPMLTFNGFHPDLTLTNLGPERSREHVTGQLHSTLVAAAYCLGLPQSQAVRLCSRYALTRIGAATVYAQARAAVMEAFAGHGHDLSSAFEAWERLGQFVYIPNHPRIEVLATLARLALEKLDLEPVEVDPAALTDHLRRGTIWPATSGPNGAVAWQAERIQVRWPTGAEPEMLSLTDYVARAYALYPGAEDILPRAPRIKWAIDALTPMIRRGVLDREDAEAADL